MSYKVPDGDTLCTAIRMVIDKTPVIETQTEFLRLVREELSKRDARYRVGGERIRRVGMECGIIEISIRYRESDAKNLPHLCPVCKNAMIPVMNRSLHGETVEIKRKCSVCPYSIGKSILVPGRYVFSRPHIGAISNKEVSIRKLRNAGAKIKEAADMIKKALDGTEFEGRGNELISELKRLTESREYSISIKNITLDIEQDDTPVWNDPVTSIKNSYRKDL